MLNDIETLKSKNEQSAKERADEKQKDLEAVIIYAVICFNNNWRCQIQELEGKVAKLSEEVVELQNRVASLSVEVFIESQELFSK